MSEVQELIDETAKLIQELKIELLRKDETYQLIADSKPDAHCQCRSCQAASWTQADTSTEHNFDGYLDGNWKGY